MNSLWRLISAEQLCCSQGPGVQQYRRPISPSIAAELKTFAQRKMVEAEEKVMEQISALIPQAFSKSNSDIPAVWASLWSVMLVYRQALKMVGRNGGIFKPGFGDMTRRLLCALTITLSEHFRTRKVLEALDNADQPSFLGRQDVMAAFERARLERRIFCKGSRNEFHTPFGSRVLIPKQTSRSVALDVMVTILSTSMSSSMSTKLWDGRDRELASRL